MTHTHPSVNLFIAYRQGWYTYTHECTLIRKHTGTHFHRHTYTYAHTHTHTYKHPHTHIYTHIHDTYAQLSLVGSLAWRAAFGDPSPSTGAIAFPEPCPFLVTPIRVAWLTMQRVTTYKILELSVCVDGHISSHTVSLAVTQTHTHTHIYIYIYIWNLIIYKSQSLYLAYVLKFLAYNNDTMQSSNFGSV